MARWNKALGARAAQERGHAHRAGGLAEDRDVAGIAAEGRDLVAHPLERGDLVEQALVAGGGELGSEARGQVQEPERAQPVVDGDHHDVAAAGERRAVVEEL
jgi:hypothetical protein